MAVLQEKGTEKSYRKFILQYAAYYAVRKRTVLPIQEIKKEYMIILQQKQVRLVNDETYRRNTDSSSRIYFTAAKVTQYSLVAENRR